MRLVITVSWVVVVSLVALGCGGHPQHDGSVSGAATPAQRFLADYVTSDGRVLRRDQGGDVVSEGQAYGMLIAELARRPSTVRTIWSWASAHLGRSDGLLSSHATASGRILDDQAATDADVLAAYALLRYDGPGSASMHDAGRRLADAVLATEATTLDGAPVLVAGPWAMSTPQVVNPSYWMPGVFTALAGYTRDDRWQRAASTAVALLGETTDGGRLLPPDWARLEGGRLVPTGAPDGSRPIEYGLDAARLPVWFGTACGPEARHLASGWWGVLSSGGGRAGDLALSQDGRPIDPTTHSLPMLASAAAAAAAGDGRSATLRTAAARQARRVPTYYGDAWLALGDALLSGSLDPCTEGSSR
jgi:endoglucanase